MGKRGAPLHPAVRTALGCDEATPDSEIISAWKSRLRQICKPCWELKYCPYGPLVEDFPLPPLTRAEVEDHLEYFRTCLKSGCLGNGEPLDENRKKWFEEDLRAYQPSNYPTEVPSFVSEGACRVFGHMCPVFFVSEPLTETKVGRVHSRNVPRAVMLKVVRRDGQICQRCHQPVADDQVEFDHIIPYAKGGATSADNLRLLHRDCNRDKSDALEELLAPQPLVHYINWKKKAKKRRSR